MEQSDQKQLQDLLKDLSNFSTRIVDRLQSGNSGQNFVVSPISIANTLALLLPGAKGETYKQIQKVLGLKPDSLDKIKQIFVAVNLHLKSLDSIKIANAVAYHSKKTINQEYQQTLKSVFDAECFAFDLKSIPESARALINWVEKETFGKVNNNNNKIIDSLFTPDTRLILLNMVYFIDKWESPFEEAQTKLGKFYHKKNEWSEVRMMEKTDDFAYAKFTEGQLLQIPYKQNIGFQMFMVIFLPVESGKPELNLDLIELHIGQLQTTKICLSLPKFRIDCKMLLMDSLRKLGIEDVFVLGRADLSTINGNHELYLSELTHQTFVEVNEKGSEAVGSNQIKSMQASNKTCSSSSVLQICVNRPFMFTIRSHSGVNLYTGVIHKP